MLVPFEGGWAALESSLGSIALACLAFFMDGLGAAVGIIGYQYQWIHVVRLQSLTFEEGFNQCRVKAALPGGLQSLTIGSGVSQGWAKVALPCVHI